MSRASSRVRSPFPRLVAGFAEARGLPSPTAEIECDVDRFVHHAEELAEAARDPHVGIALARWIPRGTYELVEYAARAASSLGESLAVAAEHSALMNDRLRMRVVLDDDEAAFEHWIDGEPGSLGRHFDEFAMATALRFVAEVADDVSVLRVNMVHAKVPGRDASELLGAPIRHGRDRNAIVLRRRDLERSVRSAEPPLSSLLRRLAARARSELPPSDVATRARIAIARAFESGDSEIGAIARALAMSVRTMERRLHDEGTSYDRVRDAYRRDLARQLLERRTPLPDAARRLRFRSVRGLCRALERWSHDETRQSAPTLARARAAPGSA